MKFKELYKIIDKKFINPLTWFKVICGCFKYIYSKKFLDVLNIYIQV